MKALGFCSKLINDLELAARYEVRSTIQQLLDELKQSGHVLVTFTNPELNSSSYTTTPDSSTASLHQQQFGSSTSSMMTMLPNVPSTSISNCSNLAAAAPFMIFVPKEFSKEKLQIIRLLFIISEKDEFDNIKQSSSSKGADGRGLSRSDKEIKSTTTNLQHQFSSCLHDSLEQERMFNCSIDSSLSPPTKNLFNDTIFKADVGGCGDSGVNLKSFSTSSPPQSHSGISSLEQHYLQQQKQQISQPQQPPHQDKTPGISSSFRRLSSSNSFVEMSNDNQVQIFFWGFFFINIFEFFIFNNLFELYKTSNIRVYL